MPFVKRKVLFNVLLDYPFHRAKFFKMMSSQKLKLKTATLSLFSLPAVAFYLAVRTSNVNNLFLRSKGGGATDWMDQIDSLLKTGRYEDCIERLSHKLSIHDIDFEALWRMSYAKWCLARDQLPKSPEQSALYKEALQFAKKAFEVNPNDPMSHKMMGIALTEAPVGGREKMSNAHKVYDHLKLACELSPSDAEAHYFFGSVCFVACVIPSPLKSVAKMFVKLPSSSFEEALAHFLTAEQLRPNFMCRNQFALGKTYERLEQFGLAYTWMKRAAEFDAKTAKDRRDKEEANQVLRKWKENPKFKQFIL